MEGLVACNTVQGDNDTASSFDPDSFISKAHINNTANAISALDITNRFITDCDAISDDTHMHIMEAIIDRRKSALVRNVFIDLDLVVQVIWVNGI